MSDDQSSFPKFPDLEELAGLDPEHKLITFAMVTALGMNDEALLEVVAGGEDLFVKVAGHHYKGQGLTRWDLEYIYRHLVRVARKRTAAMNGHAKH